VVEMVEVEGAGAEVVEIGVIGDEID